MKKRIIVFVCFVFLTMFFSGCSMMPSDDEIIKGSVVDNEIFGDELVDDGLDNEELGIDNEEGEEKLQNENEELVEEDGDVDDGKSEVDVEVVD